MEEQGADEDEKEIEADAFAGNILIPPEQLKRFLASCAKPTLAQITRFTESIGTAPGIVVGRLQHDKIIPMSWGQQLKVRYEWVKNNG